jgi:transposase InsO family protein
VEAAQAAIDAFRAEYNSNRPHQSLGMAFPAERFLPRPSRSACRCMFPLR